MENASNALMMAAGVLVGVLILALMVTLFASSSSVSRTYENSKHEEAVQQFNSNFTKYVGKDLTIHEVVTICNYANKYGVSVVNSSGSLTSYNESNIKTDVASYTSTATTITHYKLSINSYSDDGYVSEIGFN